MLGTPEISKNKTSFLSLVLNNIKRTVPTMLSYDASISILALGLLMTRLDQGSAAPATTTLLSSIIVFQFAGILSSSFTLGELFGELKAKKEALSSLEVNGQEYDEMQQQIQYIKQKISKTPKNAIAAASIYSPLCLLSMAFSGPLLTTLGQNAEIASSAQQFFDSYAPFFLTSSPRLAMEFVLLASQKTNTAMLLADFSLLTTLGLAYALGFKTPLGLSGLGLAFGAGSLLTATGFTLYVVYHFKELNFMRSAFSWDKSDFKQIRDLITTGGPIVLTVGSDISVAFAISVLAGLLPGYAVRIQNMATQYLNANFIISAAASQTTALTVSQEMGKAKVQGKVHNMLKKISVAGITSSLLLQFPLAFFVSGFPSIWADLVGVSKNDREIDNIRLLMMLSAGYALLDGMRSNMLQVMRSVGDNTIPSIVSSAALWLGVLASGLLMSQTNLGIIGLPLGLIIGVTLGLCFLYPRLNKALDLTQLSLQINKTNSPSINTPLLADSSSHEPDASPIPFLNYQNIHSRSIIDIKQLANAGR